MEKVRSLILFLVPISGRVDIAFGTETTDRSSISGRVKPKTKNWYSQLPCLTFSDSIVCGRQVGRWQLDSKTERFLPCFLAKTILWTKCDYSLFGDSEGVWRLHPVVFMAELQAEILLTPVFPTRVFPNPKPVFFCYVLTTRNPGFKIRKLRF